MLYYLVREMGALGVRAKDVYFDDALAGLKEPGRESARMKFVRWSRGPERNRLSGVDEVMGYGRVSNIEGKYYKE